MGKALHWIGDEFMKLVHGLGSLWDSLMNKFAQSSIVKYLSSWFTDAFAWIGKMLGKMTPQFAIDALNQAKTEREARERKASEKSLPPPGPPPPGLPPPDTSGLGKETESPVNKLLANLREQLEESKQVLAAAGLEEQAQRKVAAANKASNEIMKLGQEIAKQTGAKTKDYAKLVDDVTQKTIRSTHAQLADNEAKTKLLDIQGSANRATDLSIAQSALMVLAIDKGADAVMRQTAATQAWNEQRAAGATAVDLVARQEKLYQEALAKEGVAMTSNAVSIRQDIAARGLAANAILGTIDAQREASLHAKLYVFDQQAITAGSAKLRQAIIDQADAENVLADRQSALMLLSPLELYQKEEDALTHAKVALANMQHGMISYGQSLQIAMREQDAFTRLIDETVKSLLFQGSAASGMKAFFLDMQKMAITSAQIIYEAMHAAFERLSDNLTELVTGGKTSFAKMFEDIGKQMVKSSIQSAMQKGLSALGKVLPASIGGPLSDALKGKPDGTRNNPLWVQMSGGEGSGVGNTGSYINELDDLIGKKNEEGGGRKNELGDLIGGLFGKKNESDDGESSGGFWSSIGKLFKGGSGGDSGGGGFWSSIFKALIPHAEGGAVSPGSAYLVGERGPEILTGASGNITSNAASRRVLGGSTGPTLYYSIDARGTDPAQTEQRTRTAILAAHNSAISNAVQVNAERLKRIPQRY